MLSYTLPRAYCRVLQLETEGLVSAACCAKANEQGLISGEHSWSRILQDLKVPPPPLAIPEVKLLSGEGLAKRLFSSL
jgi:hypothetical protein